MVNRLTNPLQGHAPPLGSLITAAGQRLTGELDRALTDAGFPELRAAHTRVFMVIDAGGTRVTDLADRMRVTKQATGELVRHLALHGYVDVVPLPGDQRVKQVVLTDRGWQAIDAGLRVVADFDRWLDDAVGADQVRLVREVLTRIVATDPADR